MFVSYPRFEGSVEISAYDFTLDGTHISINFMGDFSSLVIHITEWADMGGGSYQGQPGNRVIVMPTTDINDTIVFAPR
jgi:hypothetical protein